MGRGGGCFPLREDDEGGLTLGGEEREGKCDNDTD